MILLRPALEPRESQCCNDTGGSSDWKPGLELCRETMTVRRDRNILRIGYHLVQYPRVTLLRPWQHMRKTQEVILQCTTYGETCLSWDFPSWKKSFGRSSSTRFWW